MDGAAPADGLPNQSDAGPDLATTDLATTCSAACNLLQQDCRCAGYACYPAAGAGRCQTAGGIGTLGTCEVPNDCAATLTCVVDPQFGVTGTCVPLCDLANVPAGCSCQKLSGSTTVGACSSSR
jgi:hypothetical protein